MELHNLSAEEQYSLLIQFRKDHPLDSDVYGEVHHIQPRSCGGTDDQENLVKLLPEEHYKAHALLPQVMLERDDINGYQKMLHAWNMMRTRVTDIDTESKEYGHLKRQFHDAILLQNSKPVSEETRRKISEKAKLRVGWHHSQETRKKIGESNRGKRHAAWNKGRKCSPTSAKQKEAVTTANRRRWADPEARRRHSEKLKEYYRSKAAAELLQQEF